MIVWVGLRRKGRAQADGKHLEDSPYRRTSYYLRKQIHKPTHPSEFHQSPTIEPIWPSGKGGWLSGHLSDDGVVACANMFGPNVTPFTRDSQGKQAHCLIFFFLVFSLRTSQNRNDVLLLKYRASSATFLLTAVLGVYFAAKPGQPLWANTIDCRKRVVSGRSMRVAGVQLLQNCFLITYSSHDVKFYIYVASYTSRICPLCDLTCTIC